MSDEVVVLKTFNNEIEAGMAQQVLQEAGIQAFVFKDDAGGMEPHLQRTNGVRLLVNCVDARRAHKLLKRDFNPTFTWDGQQTGTHLIRPDEHERIEHNGTTLPASFQSDREAIETWENEGGKSAKYA